MLLTPAKGTPLVNGSFDLFSYCLFLKILDMPTGLFSQHAITFSSERKLHNHLKKQFSYRLDRGLLRQVMFQMSLKDCALDVALTTKHEQLHQLELDEVELAIYKRLENRIRTTASQSMENVSTTHMMLLSYIVYLRQGKIICEIFISINNETISCQ
ncbi:MAG: hypothetical protein EOP45_10760 [Sphingobacteriaceae bacterium]|nr:MAG: hypothetical protein EOP45_10760 [Sphingobacteriaceae bacterium]